MNNLLEFLAKFNYWFVFLLLEIISFVLLFQFNSYQGSVWFTSANSITGKVYEWDSALESFFSLTQVNKELTQRNILLEHQVSALSQQVDTLANDSNLAKKNLLAALSNYHLISAKVVSNSINKADNLITIDKGENDGIRKDMGVVCGNGVVGIVYLVSPNYSIVMPVLNSQSNISCTILGRGYFGYLHWRGGSSKIAYVDDVPRHAHFALYDKVITSGYSSVFPPGVHVGKILHVYNSRDGLSYRLQIELSTDFGNIRDVCVIDDATLKERLEILRAAQDSIKPKEAENQ
nr:rod shape-determining protein MreC [Prevotella sp.]